MRIVRWTSQQRVDIPDKVAENFQMLGEFRRLVRALIVGNDVTTAKIVRGFKVEATSPASSSVQVVLQPNPGDPLATAFGAEDMGAYLDWGQIIGDKDHYNSIEGNDTNAIDFALEAPGTLGVFMRFVYTTGANDNRAFWNPATDTEYIAATDTRHEPALEFVISGASPGDEYVHLATVAWDGSTIDAADITDEREMLFEGASPATQTTQTGSGGMPDFDRSAARADATEDSVYSVLKKLGRQIQDLKGPSDAGTWSFYERPQKPLDPDGLLAAGLTRSLATMDTREYTIGDGTTSWGDFNGSSGLQDCLEHIEASQASLPMRVRIRVKSAVGGLVTSPQFTLDAALTFTETIYIEIVGDVASGNYFGRVPVAFTHPAGPYFDFTGTTDGGVLLKNLHVTNQPAQEIFRGTSGVFCTDNCYLQAATGTYIFRTQCMYTRLRDSEIYGSCQFYRAGSSSTPNVGGGIIENCVFGDLDGTPDIEGHIRLWNNAAFDDTVADADQGAGYLTFLCCEFRFAQTNVIHTATSARPACIDGRRARNCMWINCDFDYGNDSDVILLGNPATDGVGSAFMKWDSCSFTGTTPTSSHHDVADGYGGATGTGWIWNVQSDYSTYNDTIINNYSRQIEINNCAVTSHGMIDAGIMRVNAAMTVAVRNSRFERFRAPNVAYSTTRHVKIFDISSSGIAQTNTGPFLMDNCRISRFSISGAKPQISFVQLSGGRQMTYMIRGCSFDLTDITGGAALTTWDADFTAPNTRPWVSGITFTSIACEADILDNTFRYFQQTGATNGYMNAITILGDDTDYVNARIRGNRFESCRRCIFGTSQLFNATESKVNLDISHNYFDPSANGVTSSLLDCSGDTWTSDSKFVIMGNKVTGAYTGTAVDVSDANNVVLSGNDFNEGSVHHSTIPGNSVGWYSAADASSFGYPMLNILVDVTNDLI